MRYLGIDYGAKRIGLALSDPEGRLAFPRSTVGTLGEVLSAIAAVQAGAIVIGLPLDADGREGKQARAVRQFAHKLGGRVQLPIDFENELFTTKIAEGHTARANADASAAAIILQSYLDKQRL